MATNEYDTIDDAIRASVAASENIADGQPRVVTGWMVIVEIAEMDGRRGLAAMRERSCSPYSRIGWLTDMLDREKRLLAFGQSYNYRPPDEPKGAETTDADD